jgi:hypothetical protein
MSYIGKTTVDGTTHLVGSTLYGTCDTAAGTAAKVATLADFDELITGVTVHIKFTYSNTASNPTLNINSTGAKNIYRYGTTAPSTSAKTSWQAGSVISFTYDGSYWQMNGWLNDDTDTNNYNTNLTAADSTNANVYNLLLSNNTATTAESNVSPRKANGLTYKQSTGELKTTQLSINGYKWEYNPPSGHLGVKHQSIDSYFVIDNGGTSFELGINDNYSSSLSSAPRILFYPAMNNVSILDAQDINLHGKVSIVEQLNVHQCVEIDGNLEVWGNTLLKVNYTEIRSSKIYLSANNDGDTNHGDPTRYIYTSNIKGFSLTDVTLPTITNFAEVHGKIMDGLVFRYRNSYLTCSTAQTTAAKVITETTGEGIDTLASAQIVKGAKIAVKFTNGSKVANATLNINSTGAKNIWYNGANVTANHVFTAGRVYEFIYKATQWELIGDLDTDTTYTVNNNTITLRAGNSSTYTAIDSFKLNQSSDQTIYIPLASTSTQGLVPKAETASNSKFLRNDNTWQTVTPANIGAATSDHTQALNKGGTGATTAEGALTNLGLQLTEITKSVTFTAANTWYDTGISGTDIPANGTYIVQISNISSTGTSLYGMIYSGVMSWRKDGTSDSSQSTEEVLLHAAGHNPNGRRIYLRTLIDKSTSNGGTGLMKLQICANFSSSTTAVSIKFRFRKIMPE